jgi:hypothetical protein
LICRHGIPNNLQSDIIIYPDRIVRKRKKHPFTAIWTTGSVSTPGMNFQQILSHSTSLPVRYWQPDFYFWGMLDETIHGLSDQRFPGKIIPFKRRPIFCMRVLPNNIGAEVCPCSTQKQYIKSRCIRKGCQLEYTGHVMDKKSYLVERIRFNIPSFSAGKLSFRGKVPAKCIAKEEGGS